MSGPDLTPPGQAPIPTPPPAAPATKVSLQPPGSAAVAGGGGGVPTAVWGGGAALLIAALAVVFLLPETVSEKKPESPDPPAAVVEVTEESPHVSAATPSTKTPAKPPAVPLVQDNKALTDLYASVLKRQAALETMLADRWAPDEWQEILDVIELGESHFSKGRNADAMNQYRKAIEKLDTLPDQRVERFEQAMAAGQAGLDRADGREAKLQFAMATAANPESEAAAIGLKRALTIEEVVAIHNRAVVHERNGDASSAQSAFQKAVDLDPLFTPAAEGLQRVSASVAENSYRQHMDELLAALRGGDLTHARRALKDASAIKPDTPELRNAQLRIHEISQGRRLDALRKTALQQEQAEDWSKAKASYQKALKIDAASSFAQDGLHRSDELIALNQKLDHYLKRPELLRDAKARKTAASLVLIANAQSAGKPQLKSKAQRLSQLRQKAAVPIPVRLISDGLTEVTLYRVARLGSFKQHNLELTPGRYTAVGSREGYVDVRVVFTVSGSGSPPAVSIVCKEPI